ncbi:MAG: hypothetical protein Q7S50_01680 [bacterium]|nr:hypothetical protein [bacterium]
MRKKPEMIITNERLISRSENEISTEYTYTTARSKREKKMLLTYTYIEPKTKEEREEQERRVSSILDPLFEATLKKWNQRKAGKKSKP